MKKYIVGLAVVSLAGFGIYKKVYIPKHTFETTTTQKSDMKVIINGVGNVATKNLYKVSTIYGGKVLDFNINLGDWVKKGELIAKIDSVDIEDKIAELQENIKVLQKNIIATQVDRDSAIKQYLYSEDVLRKNQKLYQKKAISELEYKKYLTDKEVAQLKVDSLNAKIDSLKQQINQINYSISGLQEKLKRYSIYAPVDGYVTKKYISNNDVINPSMPIIEIVNPKDVWVSTPIDTRISADVKINDKAMIKLRSSKTFKKGYVVKINPINNAVTNEREIFVKFDKLPIPFYLNEQAIVNIKVGMLKNVNIIPSKVVSFYKGKYGVWVIENKKLHFIKITILNNNGKKTAIKENITQPIVIPNPKKAPLKEGTKTYND